MTRFSRDNMKAKPATPRNMASDSKTGNEKFSTNIKLIFRRELSQVGNLNIDARLAERKGKNEEGREGIKERT